MSVTGGHDRHNDAGGEVVQFRPRRATTHQAGEVEDASGHQPGDDLAPVDASDIEHQGPVYEAELVEDDQPRQLVPAGVTRVLQPVVLVVRQACKHDRTVATSKLLLRHLVYTFTGVGVLAKRVWDAKTNSPYARAMRAAESANDWPRWGDVEERGQKALAARHGRRMDGPKLLIRRLIALGIGTVAFAVLLLLIGLALASSTHDFSLVFDPLLGTVNAVGWLAAAVMWLVSALAVLGPFLAVGSVWFMGWKAGAAPSFLRVAHDRGTAVAIDEVAIAHALGNLGISALTQAVRRGHQFIYTKIPARDGERGVSASVRLVAGVAAREVVERKSRLAANFGRSVVETWPEVGSDEQVLDMFIADRGALDTGAGPWPLLETVDPIDCFRGVPVGKTLRGEPAVPPLDGTSWLIGGRPGQGKTNFTRLLVMGACLDPRARKWVHVLADNADYDPLAEEFERYAVGMGNDTAEQAMQAFNDLLAEIERRGRVMREQGVASAAEAGFEPIVAAFDEVHRLFQHREYGADAAFVAEDLVKQARKYGIILILTTQSPTSTSIPRAITREVICRVAYSVIDQVGNDALLGDGSYRNGVRATELRPGSKHSPGDRGKAIAVGVVPDSDWELLLGHHVDLAGVRHIAQLARQFRAGQQGGQPVVVERRDLLADIAEVIGQRETPAGEVPALLRQMFPRHAAYRRMQRQDVLDGLKAAGLIVPKTQNRWPVRPEALAAVLRARVTESGPPESPVL